MTTPNDRQRQAEEAAKKREKEWSADADWDDPETAAAIANVYDGYLQGWTDADSTPPPQEGDEEAAEKLAVSVAHPMLRDMYSCSRGHLKELLKSTFLLGSAHARRAQNAEIERLYGEVERWSAKYNAAKETIKDMSNTINQRESEISELRALLDRAKGLIEEAIETYTNRGLNPRNWKDDSEWLSDYERRKGKQ